MELTRCGCQWITFWWKVSAQTQNHFCFCEMNNFLFLWGFIWGHLLQCEKNQTLLSIGFHFQTVVPGNRNNAMLQNLLHDTPYNITVEAIYAEGPGGSLNGNGRTGEAPNTWILTTVKHGGGGFMVWANLDSEIPLSECFWNKKQNKTKRFNFIQHWDPKKMFLEGGHLKKQVKILRCVLCSFIYSPHAQSQKSPGLRWVVHQVQSSLGPGSSSSPGIQTHLLSWRWGE